MIFPWGRHGSSRHTEKHAATGRLAAVRPLGIMAILFWATLYSTVFTLAAWWLDRQVTAVSFYAYLSIGSLLSNALPGLLAAAFLFGLTRRLTISFLISAGIYGLMYAVSVIKLKVLKQFLALQDFLFVGHLNTATFQLFFGYLERPLLSALLIIVAIGTLVLLWKKEQPLLNKTGSTRWVLVLAPVGAAFCLTSSGIGWDRLYNADTIRPSRFSDVTGILHRGLVSNIIYTKVRNFNLKLEVDEKTLSEFVDTLPARTPPTPSETVRPDIVVILSESLFDPRKLNGMEGLPDPIPNVRKAIEAGMGGEMEVPAFGGGTIRTEFEILTGMPVAAFPATPFPYMSLARKKIPSLPLYLKQFGYRTVAIHGNSGAFWNRSNTFKSMGFDKFITEAEFPIDEKKRGRWASDTTMSGLILNELAGSPEPTMILAISMEAHGPYTDKKKGGFTEQRDAIRVPNKLKGQPALELRNYLFHIRNADRQLGRMFESLSSRDRPTVVLFFGDHLPGLGRTYKNLGFVNRQRPEKQYVPWILRRTDRQDEPLSTGPIKSWMLPGQIIEMAGLPENPYFQFTNLAMAHFLKSSTPVTQMNHPGVIAGAIANLEDEFSHYYPKQEMAVGSNP